MSGGGKRTGEFRIEFERVKTCLGDNIRKARELRGLSQRDLADRILTMNPVFKPQYVSDIENGKANPTLETLRLFSLAFGTTLEDLLHGT